MPQIKPPKTGTTSTKQTSKTEYTTDKPGQASPSWEQPFEEGGELDRDEAIKHREGERDKPTR